MTHAMPTLIMLVLYWTYVAFPPTMLTVVIVQILIRRKA